MKTYPLLQSQLGVLLSCVSSPLSTSYNLPTMVQFPKGLGANRLEDAIKRVIARRPVLKTRFVKEENGNIRQYVDESIDIPIVKHTSTESKALLYVQQFVRPFPLFSGQPLCRFEIIETEQWIYLLADFHHTIADGITLAQLFWNEDLPECLKSSDELKDPEKNGRPRIYNESVKPAPTPAMYLHALEEQASFKTPAYHKAATYYQERFKDVEFTRLSTNVANPKGTIIRESAYLPSNDIDQWCDENGVSPNLLLMAAFTLALSRLSRQQQVAYLTLNHGRTSKHLRNAYGMFVKSVPVAISVDESLSAISFIRSFRKELITTIRYSVYPITHLCRSLQVAPHITFAFQGPSIHEVVTLEGQSLSGSQLFNVDGNQKLLTGSNDLSCLIYQNDGVYEIRTESSEKLNNHSQLKLVAQAVKNCALRMMEDGERILADIGLLSDDEQQHIISLSQGERLEYNKRQTFIDLFLRQAALTPKATAVVDEQGALSYAELDALSADIARQLIAKGFKPNQFVGIMTFRNKEFVAAAIAVERVGGAYLPLDHELPKERLQWIIKDAGIKIVISENVESYESSISSILSGIDRISGISRISASLTHNKLDSTINIATPSSLAYMIYTSGTTGQPKGVVISHSAKLNLIHFITKQWQLTDKSRIACHSSFAFDASVEDLFPVLTVGGTLYIVPENIRKDMRQLHAYLWKNQITGGCYTTTFGVMLAQYGELPVKYLCLGGEQLNTQLVAPYHIFNTYGPTEFTVDATFHELRCEPIDDSNSIGRPLYNLAAYVVDRQGHLLPQGAIGELWLSGCQIAEGYWNQPQLTSEKFTQCRFAKGKVYHTGDLVRWNQDGLLEFIGRTDSQIKLRGYRIELGEIEQAIMKTEGILACKVVLRKPDKRLSEEHLTAYYTAHKEIQDKEFKELLKSSLPSYMIPSLFVRIDKMPLTNNGKTDLSRLPIPSLSSKHCLTPPTNDNETLLCNLFAEVLGIESVATDDRLPSRRESDKTMSNDAAAADGSIRDALKDMVSPLLIGNITTVGAFASLIPLDAPALRDLGLFAAFMLIGTILFVLVFLPHLVRKNRNEGKEFLLFGRLSSLSFKRHGWLAGVIAVLTIVFGYFSLNTSFDADMHHINYLTPTQERLMSDLKVSAGVKDSSSVYVVTEGATWEEALKKRSELSPLLDSLERGKQISSCTDVTDFICSEEQQSEKIRRWDRFWATHRTEALAQLRKYARKNGFSDEAFQGFEGIVTAKYSPHSFDYFEPLVSVLFGQSFSNSTGNCSVIDIVKPGQSSMSEVEDIINPQLSTYAFDFAGMNSAVANALSDDFNYIGFACGIIVFVFLWLSFGRIELSLLAFLPMALGWIWILGIMDILGMQFNIVNVILATFIFGQGDDYTIFMTDGLINEYAYRRKLLPSYKNSIIISALIMFIGMGSLIVAKHPALHSLAEVTIVGMLTVVLMAWVIPPMVFNWLTMNNNRLPSRRESDKTMSKESVAADGRLPSRRKSDKTMSPDAAAADGSVRRAPVTIEQIIRTIYCFIVYLFEILYGCLFGIIVKLIPFRREQCKLWFHKVICKTMKINIHNIWGVKTFIHNDSAEDFSKGSIIISNHQSILDPILMLALNPRVLILVSGKVWRNPVVHTLFKLAGFIKLTQPMENSPLEKEIAAAISKGYNVVLFPEGKRNEENITRFHKGAFYLAQKLDVDILPVYLHGVGHVMPKGSGFASRGQIDVFVGERIPAAKLSEYGNSHQLIAHHFYKSYQERLSEIRKEIETTHYFRNHVINMYIYKGIGIERETRKLLDKYDDFSKWIDGELKDETSSLSPLTFQFSPSDDRLPSWRESDKTMSKESVATDDRLSIFNAGKGQFSLMYALVHPEIEVHSYVNDADDAALFSACPLPPNLHIHYK